MMLYAAYLSIPHCPLLSAEHIVLESDDLKVVNAFGQENVKPKTTQQTTMDNEELTSMLHKASWNVIRLVRQ